MCVFAESMHSLNGFECQQCRLEDDTVIWSWNDTFTSTAAATEIMTILRDPWMAHSVSRRFWRTGLGLLMA
jgi:hypothetical protein